MQSTSTQKIYNAYLESCFAHSNVFSKEEYQNSCREFEFLYGSVLPSDKSSRILDIGCGAGHFLCFLDKKGYTNFLGIDISPQQIEFCANNVSRKVQVADAFVFLSESSKQYDVIVAHDVLEHIRKEEALRFLELAHDSLADKGSVIIRVPNMGNPLSLDSRYRDFSHETGYTEKSLYQILFVAGFKNIRISSSEIPIRSFRGWIRKMRANLLHKSIRRLYYIQGMSPPHHLGKNLIAICRKN